MLHPDRAGGQQVVGACGNMPVAGTGAGSTGVTGTDFVPAFGTTVTSADGGIGLASFGWAFGSSVFGASFGAGSWPTSSPGRSGAGGKRSSPAGGCAAAVPARIAPRQNAHPCRRMSQPSRAAGVPAGNLSTKGIGWGDGKPAGPARPARRNRREELAQPEQFNRLAAR